MNAARDKMAASHEAKLGEYAEKREADARAAQALKAAQLENKEKKIHGEGKGDEGPAPMGPRKDHRGPLYKYGAPDSKPSGNRFGRRGGGGGGG